MWFKRIQGYYNDNLWTKEQVKMAVVKGKITEDEYKVITGEDYTV